MSEALDTEADKPERTETRQFDLTKTNAATLTVVETIASLTGQSMTELEPLGAVIDTDALNRFFSNHRKSGMDSLSVQFEYEGCRVCVTGDGKVTATIADASNK